MTTRIHIDCPLGTITVEKDSASLKEVEECAQRVLADLRDEDQTSSLSRGFGFTSHVSPQWDHDRQSGSMRRPVRAEGSQ